MLNFIKLHRTVLLLAVVSSVMYASFAYDLVRSDFFKLIFLYTALFFLANKIIQISRTKFLFLAILGITFRLIFIGSEPNLSQDFYRFLWDGRLLLEGINPYLYTPEYLLNDPSALLKITIPQAEELYNGMGSLNAGHYSNYPPINQLFFLMATFFGGNTIIGPVIFLRSIMILADIGILYFGRKLLVKLNMPTHNIFWYFLNPFIIIELTGNLHFEGVMLFFMILSLYLLYSGKWIWAASLFAVSISVKLIPLLFLPLFYQYFVSEGLFSKGFWKLKKFIWIILGVVMLTFAPFFSSEFISNFSETILLWFRNFEFNASVHYLIRWIGFQTVGWNLIETTSKILPAIILIFILIISFIRTNKTAGELITAILIGISFYFLLSTTVHPWYIATPLLLSVFTKYKFPVVWSLMVMISYSAYGPDGFSENLWMVALEYIIVIGFAVWEFFLKKPQLIHPIQNT